MISDDLSIRTPYTTNTMVLLSSSWVCRQTKNKRNNGRVCWCTQKL